MTTMLAAQTCARPSCSNPVEQDQTGRPKLHCSRNCQQRHWDETMGRAVCESCGEPMGVGSRHRDYRRCDGCRRAADRERVEARYRRIQALWDEGLTLREIATALGMTRGCVGQDANRMRREGWSLPKRRPYYGNGR